MQLINCNLNGQTPLEKMVNKYGIKQYKVAKFVGNSEYNDVKLFKFEFDDTLIVEYAFTRRINDKDYVKIGNKNIYLNHRYAMPHIYSFIFNGEVFIVIICYHIDDILFHDESRYIYLIDTQNFKVNFVEAVNAFVTNFGDFNQDGRLDYLNEFNIGFYFAEKKFKKRAYRKISKREIDSYYFVELNCLHNLSESRFSPLVNKKGSPYFIKYAIPPLPEQGDDSKELKVKIIDKKWFSKLPLSRKHAY